VKSETFHFEVRDCVNQFVAAFNDVVITRFNNGRSEGDKIHAQFTYAPKQRVLHDLVNKSKHIRLPVISVIKTSVNRDVNRVFNKGYGMYFNKGATEQFPALTSYRISQPVPVNIGLQMTIMTRYGMDMDQIISNFLPYNNPYIIISWKVPGGFISEQDDTNDQEIRTKVLWDGSIPITYPTDLTPDHPARIVATTNFTVEGWLFPKAPAEETQNIMYIDSAVIPVTSVNIDGF
tara:strand:+ start:3829 stop:4530 length:702 start_codon:yes stop_codon:yes gene_type:complete